MPVDCETYRLLYVFIAKWQPENRMLYVYQQRYRENENIILFLHLSYLATIAWNNQEIFYFLHHIFRIFFAYIEV